MSRVKRPIAQPKSIEEVENIMAEYAMHDAKIKELTAKMDQQMTAIREKYADDLQAYGDKREDCLNSIQVYAESHPELFQKRKSMELAHGTIGFRTGNPKLKLVKGFTWNAVTNLLKKVLPDYVRTVEEPAKDRLLADRDRKEVAKHFGKDGIGCLVDQDETFFVELKKEEFAQQQAA